ncbi:MAG: helix-hairpin-helix domain-containing protein [Victivallaceae bacterium]
MDDTRKKLDILSEASQYDLACACGTGKEDRRHRNADGSKWLYPVPLPRGGYSILLKTLLSNCCSNDCKYCPLRSDANARRCSLTPEETARLFMEYYRSNKVFGLFLSSGVIGTPDNTMQQLNTTVAILRRKYGFRGYVHLKIIPGASDAAVEEAISLSTAVSLNIETPGEKYFKKLSAAKDFNADIVRPVKLMSRLTAKGEKFAKVKCTTQFIVGAADEKDMEIVDYMDAIYSRLRFERVYFSAYQPGLGARDIPGERNFTLKPEDHLMREHRLYQCDFLLRQYGFEKDDLIFGADGNLKLDRDPKQVWAENHPERFPVNINRATKNELLRVPGIGPETARKIMELRKIHRLNSLTDIGLKGAQLTKAQTYCC